MRPSQLQEQIGVISPKVLTQTLRRLDLAGLAVQRLENAPAPAREVVLGPKLVVRGSSGPPPAGPA
jgi:DNA-binding HxlR family transcriptional regulator